MLKLPGYILIVTGLTGALFFLNYTGTLIPVKGLWFVISIFMAVIGVYFIVKHRLQGEARSNSSRLLQQEKLRQAGEEISIMLDNCEIKSRSWQQEKVNDDLPGRIEMVDGLFAPDRNHKTEEVIQTYIVFYKQYGNKTFKFISQPTAQSEDVVRKYIDKQGEIYLYVDRQNPANYFFDLPF